MTPGTADWPNPWTLTADATGIIADEWYVWTTDFIGGSFQ